MIACIIEFSVKSGMEAAHRAYLTELMAEVETVDGFISKDTYDGRGGDGTLLTVSLWRDEASLAGWMAHERHRVAMREGRDRIFSFYRIRVAEVIREYAFQAEEADSAPPAG